MLIAQLTDLAIPEPDLCLQGAGSRAPNQEVPWYPFVRLNVGGGTAPYI